MQCNAMKWAIFLGLACCLAGNMKLVILNLQFSKSNFIQTNWSRFELRLAKTLPHSASCIFVVRMINVRKLNSFMTRPFVVVVAAGTQFNANAADDQIRSASGYAKRSAPDNRCNLLLFSSLWRNKLKAELLVSFLWFGKLEYRENCFQANIHRRLEQLAWLVPSSSELIPASPFVVVLD